MNRDETFEKRKQTRLKNYDYSSNGAYFVTVCTHDRQQLFGEIEKTPVGAALRGRPNNPHKMIEKWIFEIEKKFNNAKTDYYVIMPDHVHFILFLSGDHAGSPLQRIMNWFKTITTNEYIKGVKNGIYSSFEKKIWQRGYYEHIIRNENDLAEIRDYIKNNPKKQLIEKEIQRKRGTINDPDDSAIP